MMTDRLAEIDRRLTELTARECRMARRKIRSSEQAEAFIELKKEIGQLEREKASLLGQMKK
jgi:phage anti-repressor protein